MNNKQIASYRAGINDAIKASKADKIVAEESIKETTFAMMWHGRITGLEYALTILDDVLDNG